MREQNETERCNLPVGKEMTTDGPSDIEDALKCWVKSPPCCWGTWWKSLPEIYHLWSDAQSVFTVKLHQQSKYLISTWNLPYKDSAEVLEGRCDNLQATFERCYSCRRALNIQLYLNFIYLFTHLLCCNFTHIIHAANLMPLQLKRCVRLSGHTANTQWKGHRKPRAVGILCPFWIYA